MKLWLLAVLMLVLYGCETVASGEWKRAGKSEAESKEDFARCQKVAMQESEGMRSVEPFKEEIITQRCMERMGYRYEKPEKK